MSVTSHTRTLLVIAATTTVALAASQASAQGQAEPPTTRGFCVKVAPGKDAEFATFLRDVAVPLNRARATAGEFDWYVALQSVIPAGSSAACDYRIVFGYKGLPPEPDSREKLEAAIKAAKINMTADQFVAKRASLASLVATEMWWGIDAVGPNGEKGAYVRVNHYKTKNGSFDEWVGMERTGWKPLMEAWLKEGGKGSWRVAGLMMPSGDAMPYDAITVDIFPDWNGLIRGVPLNDLWPKVHPDISQTEAFDRLDRVRNVYDREVYQVAEIVNAK